MDEYCAIKIYYDVRTQLYVFRTAFGEQRIISKHDDPWNGLRELATYLQMYTTGL